MNFSETLGFSKAQRNLLHHLSFSCTIFCMWDYLCCWLALPCWQTHEIVALAGEMHTPNASCRRQLLNFSTWTEGTWKGLTLVGQNSSFIGKYIQNSWKKTAGFAGLKAGYEGNTHCWHAVLLSEMWSSRMSPTSSILPKLLWKSVLANSTLAF